MIRQDDIILFSESSSLKIAQQGSGSISVPYLASGFQVQSVTIPHNINNDNLLIQVGIKFDGTYTVVPFQSNDGRINCFTAIDGVNLYISVETASSASAFPAKTFEYFYRIIIP